MMRIRWSRAGRGGEGGGDRRGEGYQEVGGGGEGGGGEGCGGEEGVGAVGGRGEEEGEEVTLL